MNKILIEANKHICLIFEPRSGSHIVRHFLSSLANKFDAHELFNEFSTTAKFTFNGTDAEVHEVDRSPGEHFSTLDGQTFDSRVAHNLATLSQMTDANKFTTFGLWIGGCLNNLDILNELQSRDDIQFIRLRRADVLYSMLSRFFATITGVFHDRGEKEKRQLFSATLPSKEIIEKMQIYIECLKIEAEYFADTPLLYYETFQYNPMQLLQYFDGIEKKFIGFPYHKFKDNYTELIVNISEIRNDFASFVNAYPNYFPQYIGADKIIELS